MSAKQQAKLTPKYSLHISDKARAAVSRDQPPVPDEALIRQERTVRSNVACTVHQLAYHLKVLTELDSELARLTDVIKERGLGGPEGLTFK